jgi:mitotic spindle assembly checkpoint protein MAD2
MVANDTVITLKGSVEIVSEFFFTAINSILYQRGKSNMSDRSESSNKSNVSIVGNTIDRRIIQIDIVIRHFTGIYQPETFKRESKYGLTVLTTTDQGLLSYLSQVMAQMESWLTDGDVQRLVVVVSGIDSGETLERWQFNVSVEDGKLNAAVSGRNDENLSHNVMKVSGDSTKQKGGKSVKEVHDEIQAIIRQITASVSEFSWLVFL